MSSQRSCRCVKSGSTRSTPGWCSSGNSTPQSMISSRPSNSSTAMLRPISPTPPSGMTRRKPRGSGGGSSSNCGTLRPYSAGAGVWSTGLSANAPTVRHVSTTVRELALSLGVPAQLRRAGPPAARHHLHRRRPRDHRRLGRGRLDDHRDRRGQGARRRGARRVPDPGQPAHRDPAVHRRAHRHQQRDGRPTRPASSRRCRRSSSSPPAPCWSPTTRRSTSGSSSTSTSSRAGPGRRSRWSTRPSWRAG